MTTLADLIDTFGANAFGYADAGNGSAYGDAGELVGYDDETAERYGAVEMIELPEPVLLGDGRTEATFASEWIEADDRGGEFRASNPYRFRILF